MEGIAAQAAMTQQAIALQMVKQTADMQQKMADILAESLLTVAPSGRGGLVDIAA